MKKHTPSITFCLLLVAVLFLTSLFPCASVEAAQNNIAKRLGVEVKENMEEDTEAAPAPADGKIRITDDTGHELVFDTPVTRVVALYGALNELLLALGLEHIIVGRTAADSHLTPLQSLPVVGTHMRPNMERILSLKPDVILQFLGRKEAETLGLGLRKLGVPVIFFKLETFDDMFRALETLGKIAGDEGSARALIKSYRDRLGDLNNALLDVRRVPVIYEVRYPHLLVAGRESIVNNIILLAGGRNIITAPTKIIRLDEEYLINHNPEAYIIQKGPMNTNPRPVEERPHYATMQAVQNDRVLLVDELAFARPGPRAIESAEMLARWLHPTIDFDLLKEEDDK